MKPTLVLALAGLLSAAPFHLAASVLVEDGFDGSAGAPPDAAKFDWGGQVALNGSGQLNLSTDTANQSWLRSKAGAAPGSGQTLVLQLRAYAYAENWNPGIYGDGQPRGLRVGSDANNAVEFYSLARTSVGLRLRKNGVESLGSYALPSGVDSMHDYTISLTTTSVCFKVDGTVAGTFTANIPSGALNLYVSTYDGGAGNVPVTLDSVSLSLTNLSSPPPPTVVTASASSLVTLGTNAGATLNGTVNPNGAAAGAWFSWGTTTNYGSTTLAQSMGSGSNAVAVSALLTNLSASTLYHYCLVATNSGGQSNGVDQILDLPSLPRIDSFTPGVGIVGTTVTITGANFSNLQVIRFNSTPAGSFNYSSSQIAVAVPAGAASGPLTVSTPAGSTLSTNAFTVIQPPVLTGFAPASGPVGTVVTISGTNLATVSAVKLNGGNLPFSAGSDSQLTATVTAGASSGFITVSNPAGTGTSSAGFLVCSPATDFNYYTNGGTLVISGYKGAGGSVSIPPSINGLPVNGIGDYAFQYVNSLTNLTIPDSVTNIGVQAFCFCRNLTNVTIGNGVVSLQNAAFGNCVSLTEIAIPRSVTSIAIHEFSGCFGLTSIAVDEMNPNYSSVGGVLCDKNQTTVLQFPPGSRGNYTIPNTINVVGNGAFSPCTGLTQVTIPDSVTNIDDFAFDGCIGLTNVTFGAGVIRLGNYAFYGCTNLRNVTLPKGLISLGGTAFSNCSLLTSITLPDSVTSIGSFAFEYCPSLTNVTLGTNVASIGMYAFDGLNLTSVTIPRSVTSIGDSAFAHSSTLTSVYFQGNAPTLGGASVFFYTPNVTIYHLPAASGWPPVLDLWAGRPTALWPLPYLLTVNSGTGSGSYTNGVRVSITASNAPDGQIFDRWTGDTQCVDSATASSTMITMPAQDTSVTATYMTNDFNYTTNNGAITITGYTGSRATVTIPATINGLPVSRIGSGAFEYCTSLTNVTIPNSITSIGYAAFFGCGGLAGVTIGTNVASIEGYAFYACGSLTSVTLPASLTSIDGTAFAGCSRLPAIAVDAANAAYSSLDGVLFDKSQTTLLEYPGGKTGGYTLPGSVTVIAGWGFYFCGSLTSVTLGNGVTNIGEGAFYYCTGMTNIALPNSLASIEGRAFYNCPSLTSLTLPPNLTTIGDTAFYNCTRLTTVTLPDRVISLGNEAFLNCTALTNATIGNAVTSLGDELFSNCSALTSVTIGSSVTSLGRQVFDNCLRLSAITVAASNSAYSSLDGVLFNKNKTSLLLYPPGKAGSYSIPSSVTSIGDWAFYFCTSLTDLTIPDSVTSIGFYAFGHCAGLTRLTIGSGVTSMVDEAFIYCYGLKDIYVKGGVPSMGWGVFYSDSQATLHSLPGTGWTSDVAGVPVDLWRPQVLGGDAGAGVRTNRFGFTLAWAGGQVVMVEACINLASPTWSPVGTYALTNDSFSFSDPQWAKYPSRFYRLRGLATRPQDYTYTTNNGAIAIESYLGSGGDVTLPGTLNGLPISGLAPSAFYGCASLTNVIIPDTITSIGDTAFAYCNNLTNITLGNGVTNVGYHAFFSCSSLMALTVDALNPALSSGNGILFNQDQTTLLLCPGRRTGNYAVPGSVTDIASGAFDHCSGLTGVTLPNSVTNIESVAFYACTHLASVTLGNRLTTIGNLAFYSCTSLTNVLLPNSVTSIAGAFSDCAGLVSVTLGNRVSDITGAFVRCPSLGYVALPESVTNIGPMAFAGCSGLTDVAIPNSVSTIGDSAFSQCGGLTRITLPNSLTSIGNYAFQYCTGLTNVTIPDKVTSIGDNAFNGCSALVHIALPNRVTSIGSTAFSGCASLASITLPASVTSVGTWLFSGCTSLNGIYFQGNAPSVDPYMFNGAPLATIFYLPGTTNWSSTLAGRPTVLWNPQVQAGFGMRTNRFGFTITGTTNLVIVVEACTNLATPVWSPVATNTLSSGSSYFSDPDGSTRSTCFYRLRSP